MRSLLAALLLQLAGLGGDLAVNAAGYALVHYTMRLLLAGPTLEVAVRTRRLSGSSARP
jgi:hypothetical protein